MLLHKTFYYAVAPTPSGIGRPQSGPTSGRRDGALTVEDLCAKLILSHRMCVGVVNTADMRLRVRNGLKARGVKDVATVIALAVRRAADAGLVEIEEARGRKRPAPDGDEEAPPPKGPKGRAVLNIKKRSWAQIQEKPTARDLAATLSLSADFFQG